MTLINLCKIFTTYRCHVTCISYAACNFSTSHIPSSLLSPIPFTVPKTMTSGLPHTLLPISPMNPSIIGPGSYKCRRHESDEQFHLTPSMELHEHTIAPVYQRPPTRYDLGQSEPCSSLHAGDSEPLYYDSSGGPSMVSEYTEMITPY